MSEPASKNRVTENALVFAAVSYTFQSEGQLLKQDSALWIPAMQWNRFYQVPCQRPSQPGDFRISKEARRRSQSFRLGHFRPV